MQEARHIAVGLVCCYWLSKKGLQVVCCLAAGALFLGFLEFAGLRPCWAVCFQSVRLPAFLVFFFGTARLGFIEDLEGEAELEWRERFRRVFGGNGARQEEPADGVV